MRRGIIINLTWLILPALILPTGGAYGQSSADDTMQCLTELAGNAGVTWKYHTGDIPGAEKPEFDDSGWQIANPEFQWGGNDDKVGWIRATIVIPEKMGVIPATGSTMTLCLGIDDAGECYVNGVLKQKFEWDRCKVVLTENAKPGDKYVIAVKAINTGGPGRMLNARLESSAVDGLADSARQILSDLTYCEQLINNEPNVQKRELGRAAFASAIAALDMNAVVRRDKQAFETSFPTVRQKLEPIRAFIKDYTVHLVGHAHIDMNWLWLWPETIDVCKNTFSTVLKLMDEFPEFRFSQSQASAYLPIEENYPDLFEQIRQKVKEGRWEITGGTWTEGDMNMASGESIVRQILYANRYFKEKFGVEPEICWEPDTFGHAWTVPQILAKSGIKYYFFCRCGAGYPVFWWEAPDGSRVLAYNRGGYGDSINDRIQDTVKDIANRYGVKHAMVVYGVGDHGGGPTRSDLTKASELQQRPDYATVKFDTAENVYDTLLAEKQDWPVVRNELNFVFEGCYTTHSDIKKMNRVLENLLPTAEAFATLAQPYGIPYPQQDFVKAWRNACFNQFHDIFDGSGIHGSYEYSRELFDKAHAIGQDALENALSKIAENVDTSGNGIPVVVFNPLSWKRTDVVRIHVPESHRNCSAVTVTDIHGRAVASQISENAIIFLAQDLPSLGYKVFHLNAQSSALSKATLSKSLSVENEFFKVQVDPVSGTLVSVYDKTACREVLRPNQHADVLQICMERPHGMTAWQLDFTGEVFDLMKAESVEKISAGPVESVIRVRHKYNNSSFQQDIVLYKGVPRIDFRMTADWNEIGTAKADFPMLKVAFPVDVENGKARFEIPFGSIERPANGREVPAQKWIDISTTDYGVSLLNDCKYGHDVKDNVMRLSLLRSSYDPDPKPDQGRHEITYSLYPHTSDWTDANTVRKGYELNNPLIAVVDTNHAGNLPKAYSFLKVQPSNVIVTALKQAEDTHDVILRFYESEGKNGVAIIDFGFDVVEASEVNLIEKPLGKPKIPVRNNRVIVPFGKWEIKALRIKLRQ